MIKMTEKHFLDFHKASGMYYVPMYLWKRRFAEFQMGPTASEFCECHKMFILYYLLLQSTSALQTEEKQTVGHGNLSHNACDSIQDSER